MTGVLFLVLATVLYLVTDSGAYTRNDSIRLMEDMLHGYNRKHRPVVDQSSPVIVNISCDVISIQNFDEVNGILSVVIVLYTQWNDEIITWDPASYGGIQSQIYRSEDVWYPLFVASTSADNFKDIVEDWMTLRIYSSGLVLFTPGILIRSTCAVDVTFYPFDKQTCIVMFTPWAENIMEVNLQPTVPYLYGNFYTEHGEWNIIDNASFADPFLGYKFKLVLKRKPLFAIINTILPIIFMGILNILVFFIPVESGERVSYTITVLLAIAVFLTLVAESLPKTSEPMSILSFFLMINLICSTSICVGTIWTVRIYFRDENIKIPEWQLKFTTNTILCRNRSKQSTNVINVKDNAFLRREKEPETEDALGVPDTCSKIKRLLTWKDVASALDTALLIIFTILIVLNTLCFMLALTLSD